MAVIFLVSVCHSLQSFSKVVCVSASAMYKSKYVLF